MEGLRYCAGPGMVAPALSATLSAALSAAAATTLAHGAVATELPLPTAPQLAWQKNEIMALIHFNMATFCAHPKPPAWLPAHPEPPTDPHPTPS